MWLGLLLSSRRTTLGTDALRVGLPKPGARALIYTEWGAVRVSFLSAGPRGPAATQVGGVEGSVRSARAPGPSLLGHPWILRDHPQLQRSLCSGETCPGLRGQGTGLCPWKPVYLRAVLIFSSWGTLSLGAPHPLSDLPESRFPSVRGLLLPLLARELPGSVCRGMKDDIFAACSGLVPTAPEAGDKETEVRGPELSPSSPSSWLSPAKPTPSTSSLGKGLRFSGF